MKRKLIALAMTGVLLLTVWHVGPVSAGGHPLLVLLRQVAADNSLTSTQIANATLAQLRTYAGDRAANAKPQLLRNLRKTLVGELQSQEEEAVLQSVKAQVQTWLGNNFPDYEMIRANEQGKLCVKIWPFGKPVVEEQP